MKIGLLGFSGSDSLESNMKDVFVSLGHSVHYVEFLPFRRACEKFRLNRIVKLSLKVPSIQKTNERRLVNAIFREKFDLIIVFTYAANVLSPSAVELMKRNTERVVAWFVDASISLLPGSFVLSSYEKVFIADLGLYRYLKDYSKPELVYLPEGHHPIRHVLETLPPHNNRIAVVGSLYSSRVMQINKLMSEGFEFSIFGGASREIFQAIKIPQSSFGPRIYYEKKAVVFAESLCVLNLPHASAWNSMNCRIFEVIAAGGILVTPKNEAVCDLLENGKHAFLYENFNELKEILQRIRRNDFDRLGMQEHARTLAKDNSLLVRAQKIINTSSS